MCRAMWSVNLLGHKAQAVSVCRGVSTYWVTKKRPVECAEKSGASTYWVIKQRLLACAEKCRVSTYWVTKLRPVV